MSKSVALVGIFAVAACVEAPAPSTAVPRIVANALSPSALANGQLITSVLNSTNAAAMGQTSNARKVLAFAASCALDPEQSVTYTVGGVEYTVVGWMGIAPGWTSAALSWTDAAWVSACVLSRVNVTSNLVYISARGDNAGYDATIDELQDFGIEEGAFWGNVFVNLGSIAGYACNGVDQAADDTYGDLPYRECAEWNGVPGSNLTPCGMNYAGLCSSVCSTSTAPYSGCAFQGGTASSTVVTTFLSTAAL